MFQTPVGFETLKRRRVIVAARARSTSLQLPIWYLIVSLILQETARDCNRKFPRRREKKPPAFLYVVTERARRERWQARGCARVVSRKYGTVVVPHGSNFAALLNAAEVWGCDWTEIRDAEVWRADKEERPVPMPHLI